jgi:hypothetical protein
MFLINQFFYPKFIIFLILIPILIFLVIDIFIHKPLILHIQPKVQNDEILYQLLLIRLNLQFYQYIEVCIQRSHITIYELE